MNDAPPELSIPRDYNFAADILKRNLDAGRGNKLAYIDHRGQYTYADLADRVERFGQVLRSLGSRREERVLICLLDTIDWPTAFLGAIKAGVVAVPVNTLMTEADYRFMLKDSPRAGAGRLRSALRKFADAIRESDNLEHVIVSGDDPHSHLSFDELMAETKTDTKIPEGTTAATTRDDMCFWLYTSGSTGRPKGAVHTHADLKLTDALYAAPVIGINENDVCYSVAKLFFAYGLGNALTFPLSAGATTVLLPQRPTPDAVAELLKKHNVTVFYAVPTFYAAFLASPAAPARSELTIRRCVSAGEALPAEIGRRWSERYGVDILDGLGSTEMLHIFLSNRPGEVKYGTSGKPLHGYDLRLVDDDGNVITKRGDMGELQVRGPTSAMMYWNNREQSRATFLGEWTRSGDKYVEDEDGYYRLLRPARRHAEGVRHVCLAVRGRGRAAEPSRRARSRRGRLAGHRRADQAQGVRGAQSPGPGERRLCAEAAGRMPQKARGLQISALDRVPHRAAENRDRQRSSASSCAPRLRRADRPGGLALILRRYYCVARWFAAVAQLVEHRIRNAGVRGSNPFRGTSLRKQSAAKAVAPKPILGEGGPHRLLRLGEPVEYFLA